MSPPPLLERPARLTEDFGSQTAVAFAGSVLIGGCPGEGESYVMRWPALPAPYEPLIVLPGRVLDVGGAPDARVVAAACAHEAGAFSVTLLDLQTNRRGELVRGEDGLLVAEAGGSVLFSPDGRLLAITGARAPGRSDAITLVCDVVSETPHRWMLTGTGTRWDGDRLVLLEEHGVSLWDPANGTAFIGDAPPRRSPDGAWTVVVTEEGLEIRGRDALERRVALEEDHREVMGWLGPSRIVVGYEAPLVVELVTLETQPLAPAGFVCRAVGPEGRVVLADEDWLYAGRVD